VTEVFSDEALEQIEERYDRELDRGTDESVAGDTRDRAIDNLKNAREGLFGALLSGRGQSQEISEWLSELVRANSQTPVEEREDEAKALQKHKEQILTAIQLAQANRVAEEIRGTGIFETIGVEISEIRCQYSSISLGFCQKNQRNVR